jgi:transposase
MERILERCCALDVHKDQVTACVHVPDQEGRRSELRAEFSTMTAELLALRDWLQGLGVTHVAMEATGVYWKPVYYLLEDDFELWLVNAQHVKNVPGRRPTSRTPSGFASCSSTGSCARASSRRSHSASCAT